MNGKDMHIVLEVFQEADISWLAKSETAEEKRMINLAGNTSQEEADTLLRVLIGYNGFDKLYDNAPKDVLLSQLYYWMDKRRLVLPGGIHFEGNGYHIYPGRCCGLENWLDIALKLGNHRLPTRREPDLGIYFLEKDGICYISDMWLVQHVVSEESRHKRCLPHRVRIEGTRRINIEDALRNKTIKVIGWEPEEWNYFLYKLDRDFNAFLEGPFQKRMEQLTEGNGRPFVRAFARCFRVCNASCKRDIKLML